MKEETRQAFIQGTATHHTIDIADGVLSVVKPHILGIVGPGRISRRIQKCSQSTMVPVDDRFSHVGVMGIHPITKQLVVVESHFKTKGPKLKSWNEFLQQNKGYIYAFEYPHINLYTAITIAGLQIGYGTHDVVDFIKPWVQYLKRDKSGVHCAELLAKCDYGIMESWVGKPSDEIEPVRFQEWALAHEVDIRRVR